MKQHKYEGEVGSKEYNRNRMRVVNRRHHMEERLNRFTDLMEVVKHYEKMGYDHQKIAVELTNYYKYKLNKDHYMEKGE